MEAQLAWRMRQNTWHAVDYANVTKQKAWHTITRVGMNGIFFFLELSQSRISSK